jgi:DNA topoisomerase-2
MTSKNDLNKYKKYDLREHIFEIPDTYVGSIEIDTIDTWVYDHDLNKFSKKSLRVCPALFKIFDEALVNAIDHSVRQLDIPVRNIKVNIDKQTGVIKVWNDGMGIDIDKHPEHNIYIPEMIFGHLLTSTNYDKDIERTVGGKNGLGIKLVSIFSKYLKLETVDTKRNKKYQQTFSNNLKDKSEPVITAFRNKPYTCIEFLPDYERFGMKHLTDDTYQLFEKRVFDACACTNDKVSVFFNDNKLHCKNFEKYIDLYCHDISATKVYDQVIDPKFPDRVWEVAVMYSDNGFNQISFVNGINTIRGGTHVNYIVNQVTKKLADTIKTKKKKIVKPNHIKEYLNVFVKATIVNPGFDSQSKETLTTNVSKFGSKCELSDKFIDKIYKSGIVERAISLSDFQEEKDTTNKLTAKKKSKVIISKLEDANRAGTAESDKCTLILTEGDSAKTLAISGLSVIGRDYYGVYPLRGKPLNVRDADIAKVTKNNEIADLIKILGLEYKKQYNDTGRLRYGKVMILADQDVDGNHITMLINNIFASMWPTLLQNNRFVIRMMTPIVKATKGKEVISFYNLTDYNNWKNSTDQRGWNIKYYKGLGTSTSKEAKEYFNDMQLLNFKYTEQSENTIDLAFNKKRADDRKKWLMQYDPDSTLDYKDPEVTYEDFVNKELIHYSNSDLERSIPHILDGFKESTRKIFFGCVKRKLYSEIKVAQLAGYISEQAAYHHGEQSLMLAIIGLAQNYVGSNNISLLEPLGQFGSRVAGGKDSAAPRYIFTKLNSISKLIFNEYDLPLLDYLDDDGQQIEPKYYIPIIPMILINGTLGIGTGFSTSIPCYNPHNIIDILLNIIDSINKNKSTDTFNETIEQSLKHTINGMELGSLSPWYLGFKGQIIQNDKNYFTKGIYNVIDNDTVEVTELPIGVWTEDYKTFLDELLLENDSKDTKDNTKGKKKKVDKVLKDYTNNSNDHDVYFKLEFYPGQLKKLLDNTDKNGHNLFEVNFKLVNARLSTTNMHLYNYEGRIQKYDSVIDVIKEFAFVRIKYYHLRKEYIIKLIEKELFLLSIKCRFINDIIKENIEIRNQKNSSIQKRLLELGYPETKYDINILDYLIKMPLSQLTEERIIELEKQTEECKVKLNNIKSTSIYTMWENELNELARAYDKYIKDYNDSLEDIAGESKPKAKSKKSSKKSKK